MKRITLLFTILLCAIACTGCGMLNAGQGTDTPRAAILYLESEELDGNSVGFYVQMSEGFCSRVKDGDKSKAAATVIANAAQGMFYSVYGGTVTPLVLTKTNDTVTYETERLGKKVKFEAQYALDKSYGIAVMATMKFAEQELLDEYLALTQGNVYGFVSSYEPSADVSFPARREPYREDSAYYIHNGYKLVEHPAQRIKDTWAESRTGTGAAAFWWQGSEQVAGWNSFLDEEDFVAFTEIVTLGYQFTSSRFNATNGLYEKQPAYRAAQWSNYLKDALPLPTVYLRSPRLWAWYLTGFGAVAVIGVGIYFLRRAQMRAMQAMMPPPQAPTQTADPFSEYSTPDRQNPFGSEYDDKK